MTALAVRRASDVELPLFVHVLGAMLLVGALFAAAVALIAAWRRTEPAGAVALTRFGLWTIAAGAFPAWIVMRVGAQWVYSEEGWEDAPGGDPGWLGIGYITADAGGLLILISLILAIIGLRRTRGETSPSTLARVVAVISLVSLAAYLVAVWAMSAKPD